MASPEQEAGEPTVEASAAPPTDPPTVPSLSPLLPLHLVQHKRHSSAHTPLQASVVQGEQRLLCIESSPKDAPPDESAAAISTVPPSSINLQSAFQSNIRNRSGDEFTLVLKYRFSAQDASQKELWLQYFAALGILINKEDDEKDGTPRREREVKPKKTTLRKSRTERDDGFSSPRDSPTPSDREPRVRPKSTGKLPLETVPGSESSPTSPPMSPSTRRYSKDISSPRNHRRGESSPTTRLASSYDEATSSILRQDSLSASPSTPRGEHLQAEPSTPTPVPVPAPLEQELPATTPRLIRVHGARNNVHSSLVPRATASLNKNDCFVLDDPNSGTIFVWKGKGANMFAKSECSDLAAAINQANYAGKSRLMNLQQGLETPAFWELLAGGKAEVADADSTGVVSIVRLYHVAVDPSTGTVGELVQVEEGKAQLRPSLLSDAAVAALDTGFEIIILDNLKELPEPLSEESLVDAARRYKRDKGRPLEVRITVVRSNSRQPLLAYFVK